ncbi:MAG TPA: NEW3 domain-containing protein [Solirubrobacterales bacterium]|nr:NEW3 domain-containing protein [Solirubrobacterales bacterium]
MSRRSNRLRVPALLIAALAALLALTPVAAAETKIGEGTSAENLLLGGEVDLLGATATYESVTGTATFAITTREAFGSKSGAESESVILLAFISPTSPCTEASIPLFLMEAVNPLIAVGTFEAPGIAEQTLVKPTSSGATMTMSATIRQAADQEFNCATVGAQGSGGEDVMSFPLTVKPEPPPPAPAPAPAMAPASAPTPAPAPAVLSIAKPKALKLAVGKSKAIRVKVSNTGSTATAPGSLRVKAPTGVIVKPERQQVPALDPGRSFSLSVRVELTAKAKPKSTLSLIGTASALVAKSSFVVKRKE